MQFRAKRQFISIDLAIDDSDLSPFEVRVYLRICRREGELGCWESVPSMAAGCRMSTRTVQHALKSREAKGWIRIERRPLSTNLVESTPERGAPGAGGVVHQVRGVVHQVRGGGAPGAGELDPKELDPKELDPKEKDMSPARKSAPGGALTPDLERLVDDWMARTEREAPWLKPKRTSYLKAITDTMKATDLNTDGMRAVFDFIPTDDFLRKNCVSPAGLLSKWKNGFRKIDNILIAMKNDKKWRSQQIDRELAEQGAKPCF
jgi:hypothetical protein